MRFENLLRLGVIAALGLSLSACDSIRREAGLTKQAPDEFAVVTKAPLPIATAVAPNPMVTLSSM